MNSKIQNIYEILKNKNFIRLKEILYFKLNKKKYDYVDKNLKISPVISEKNRKIKIAVYTCVIGDYDCIIDEQYTAGNIDYYYITDDTSKESKTWKIVNVKNIYWNNNKVLTNRYIKLHPHEIFKDNYDISIYIDGNIKIIDSVEDICTTMLRNNQILGLHRHAQRDCIYTEGEAINHLSRFNSIKDSVNRQLKEYSRQGFPKNIGLYENTIIIRQHNNLKCIHLMDEWWQQILQYSPRDQISLPYVLYKYDEMNNIFIIGNNLKKSKYFKYYNHKN